MVNDKNEIVNLKTIRHLAGKLLLYEEIKLDSWEISQLTSAKILRKIPSITKNKYFYTCQRCNNKKESLFGIIPCAKCEADHIYCRNCIRMGRIMTCEPLYEWRGPEIIWPRRSNPCRWSGELTADQNKAAQRIIQAITHKERELLLWAVTGSGKTEMLFPGITFSLKKGLRICIATPRVDVVRELLPRLRRAFPTVNIEGLYGGSDSKDGMSQLIIATTHQLFRFQHAFDVMIIDEIDAFPYHKDKSLPFATNRAVKTTGTLIYLTATPRRLHLRKINNKTLSHIFIPRRYHNNPLPIPQYKLTPNLKKQLSHRQLPNVFTNWYQLQQQQSLKRQLLIFVPTIHLAEQLTSASKEYFSKFQKSIDFVHAEDKDREQKVTRFREDKIQVLITTTILERGVTFPSVDVVVLHAGHEVFDTAALVQISGRAGRHPKDPTGHVIFIHDGKTRAMEAALQMIRKMNKRAGFI